MINFITICFLAVSLLAPTITFASPYLVSDPSADGAIVYQIEIDGSVVDTIYSGDTVHWDLVALEPGNHTVRGRFGKRWNADAEENPIYEWSEWSLPFGLTRPEASDSPINQRMRP
jgi:hypothetical protein